MAGVGRPRDPEKANRIVATTTALIALEGMSGLNADRIADEARVGKASIYRRWRTLPDLLAAVVEDLGIRPEDFSLDDNMGAAASLRRDVSSLFIAAGSGPRAVAEVAVLPLVGRDERLAHAYHRGPLFRLLQACDRVAARERIRGGHLGLHAPDVIHAGVALLHKRMATTGRQVQPAWIEDALDYLVLPALGRQPVRS